MSQSEFELLTGLPPPPTEDELPYDDGEPMESDAHRFQMYLLIETLLNAFGDREDVYVGGNQAIYYTTTQQVRNEFKAPDFFAVVGDTNRRARKSWVVWGEEGRTPDVVVEILSPKTEANDRGPKKRIYAHVLKTPEYFLLDLDTLEVEAHRLAPPAGYAPLPTNAAGRWPSAVTGLELGLWTGPYLGQTRTWLRWFEPTGRMIPTGVERAEEERVRADAERERAEEERERAEEERVRAEEERGRAEEERGRADAERERAEAAVAGLTRGLLAVLDSRGLDLTDEQRARVSAERDPALLTRWLCSAATAASAADLLGA